MKERSNMGWLKGRPNQSRQRYNTGQI